MYIVERDTVILVLFFYFISLLSLPMRIKRLLSREQEKTETANKTSIIKLFNLIILGCLWAVGND